jgi:hypothetical protein
MEPHELELTIQNKYDENYQSDFYASSTVSVCMNSSLKETWIQKRQRIREMEFGRLDEHREFYKVHSQGHNGVRVQTVASQMTRDQHIRLMTDTATATLKF